MAMRTNKKVKDLAEESFLEDTSADSAIIKLRLEILKDVITDRLEDAKSAKQAVADKANRQKILEIIAKKSDESLEDKTIEELTAML